MRGYIEYGGGVGEWWSRVVWAWGLERNRIYRENSYLWYLMCCHRSLRVISLEVWRGMRAFSRTVGKILRYFLRLYYLTCIVLLSLGVLKIIGVFSFSII